MELSGTKQLHRKATLPVQLCWLQSRVYGPTWCVMALQPGTSFSELALTFLCCPAPSHQSPLAAERFQAVGVFHLVALYLPFQVRGGSVAGQPGVTQACQGAMDI